MASLLEAAEILPIYTDFLDPYDRICGAFLLEKAGFWIISEALLSHDFISRILLLRCESMRLFLFSFFFAKQGVHLGLSLLISERHRFGSETKRLFTDL